jgi:DNA-binding NtrC family response regulator
MARSSQPGRGSIAAVARDSTISTVSLAQEHEAPAARAFDQLILLAVSDDPTVVSSRHVLDGVDEVRFGRGRHRETRREAIGGRAVLTLRVPDHRMSTEHGRLIRGPDAWVLDDPGSKNGAVVDGVRTRRTALRDGAVIELGHCFFLYRRAPLEDAAPDDVMADQLRAPTPALATFVGPLIDQLAGLARVAPTEISIVLLGESGTGKEIVARAVHALSGRRGAFVAVNCGALPHGLVEGELFGHQRGSFTGALHDRPGLIRSAEGGTLLLDEIAELPAPSQVALLRVLQEREVVPVGADRPTKVDVRLCAATLRDLDQRVAAGRFREDLYARLSGFTVELPPLRERRADLGMLMRALLARTPRGQQARFAPAALRAILRHDWPLNIRELEKALGSAVALAAGEVIEPRHLPPAVRRGPRDEAAAAKLRAPSEPRTDAPSTAAAPAPTAAERGGELQPLAEEIRELEIARLRAALETTGGNQTRAAALLSIPIRTFSDKIKQYGLATARRKRGNR